MQPYYTTYALIVHDQYLPVLHVHEKKDLKVCDFLSEIVDPGNFWSASVEIQVGLSSWPQSQVRTFQSLVTFMKTETKKVADLKG